MTFREFSRFLRELSSSKDLDLKLIQNALVSCGPPKPSKNIKTKVNTDFQFMKLVLADDVKLNYQTYSKYDQSYFEKLEKVVALMRLV